MLSLTQVCPTKKNRLSGNKKMPIEALHFWPAQSPDLNPIEQTCLALVKLALYVKGHHMIVMLEYHIVEVESEFLWSVK
jgi:transposase